MNYATAKNWYSGRLNKWHGRKIGTHTWMKLDKERDCFVLSEARNTRAPLPDPNNPERNIWTKLTHEHWAMAPFAEIYPDRVVVFRDTFNSTLKNTTGLNSLAPRSAKIEGRLWQYQGKSKQGILPVTLYEDGFEVTQSGVRTFDKEKQKELNDLIKKVRRMARARAKLGAFNKVDYLKLNEKFSSIYSNKWQAANNGALYVELLKAVSADDIESFYPILWLVDPIIYCVHGNPFNTEHFLKDFDKAVSRVKESMRIAAGVVHYA